MEFPRDSLLAQATLLGNWGQSRFLSLHVIQRGNNRQPIFFCEDDYRRLRTWLAEAAAAQDCTVHAYVTPMY
jgi:hypothetical protein